MQAKPIADRLKQTVEEAIAVLPPEGLSELADALSLVVQEQSLLKIFLAAIHSAWVELQWEQALAKSPDKLARMAERAREAYEAGDVEPLDLNKL